MTVAYERFRGLRDKGQRRGGGYDVNKSKTVPVPLERLYAAFGARERKRWMPERTPRVKKATRGKSMRLTWDDGLAIQDSVGGIEMITPQVFGGSQAKYRDRVHNSFVIGVNQDWPEVNNFAVDQGRFFNKLDLVGPGREPGARNRTAGRGCFSFTPGHLAILRHWPA